MTDMELDKLIQRRKTVEIRLWGEVDYRGTIVAYSKDALKLENGDWYIRGIAEVWSN